MIFYMVFSWDLFINVSIREGQWLSVLTWMSCLSPSKLVCHLCWVSKFSFKGRIVLAFWFISISHKNHIMVYLDSAESHWMSLPHSVPFQNYLGYYWLFSIYVNLKLRVQYMTNVFCSILGCSFAINWYWILTNNLSSYSNIIMLLWINSISNFLTLSSLYFWDKPTRLWYIHWYYVGWFRLLIFTSIFLSEIDIVLVWELLLYYLGSKPSRPTAKGIKYKIKI